MAFDYFDFYSVNFFGSRKMPMKQALKDLGFNVKDYYHCPIRTTQKWNGGRFPEVFHEAMVKTFDVGSRGAGPASEAAAAFAKELQEKFPDCQVSVKYHAVD